MKKYTKGLCILLVCFANIARGDLVSTSTNNHKFSHNRLTHEVNVNSTKEIKHKQAYLPLNKKEFFYFIKKISFKVEGIEFKENLDFLAKDYLNKYLDLSNLADLNTKLTQYFIDQDYLLPHISIKEKDLKRGILTITIRMESLKDVIIVGKNNYLIEHYAKKILETKPTKIKNTQKYLALMSKIPGYEIQYKLRKDIQYIENNNKSATDLVVIATQGKGSAFANVDNYGLNELGKTQALADVQIFAPFTETDSISFNALTTNQPDRLYDIGAKYSFALNNIGTRGYFIISHAEDNPTRNFAYNAKNSQQNNFSFITTHPIYLTTSKNLEASLGTHYKTLTDYNLDNNDTPTKFKSIKYWSEDLGLEYVFKDSLAGENIIRTNFVQGIDGNSKNYEDPNDIADKHFNLVKFHIYREQELPNNFSIFAHFAANYSNKALPDQELFVLGGKEFGRGYPFGTLDGTKMVAFAFEVRYRKETDHNILHEVQPYLFIDTGHIGKQGYGTNISTLSSTGAGLRFKMFNDVDFSTEIAQPFKKKYTVDGYNEKASTRINLFLNKIFRF